MCSSYGFMVMGEQASRWAGLVTLRHEPEGRRGLEREAVKLAAVKPAEGCERLRLWESFSVHNVLDFGEVFPVAEGPNGNAERHEKAVHGNFCLLGEVAGKAGDGMRGTDQAPQ